MGIILIFTVTPDLVRGPAVWPSNDVNVTPGGRIIADKLTRFEYILSHNRGSGFA